MQWTYAEQLTDFSKEVRGEELISIRHQELGDPMQPEFLSHKDPSKLLTTHVITSKEQNAPSCSAGRQTPQ